MTSATFGDSQAHGGKIADRNRHRSPVSGSTRLSLIRGAGHFDPARGRGDRARLGVAVRTTRRRPARRPGQPARRYGRPPPPTPRQASAGRRRGRSHRANERISVRASSSVTTLSIGVPSSPTLRRRQSSFRFNEEGTSRPSSGCSCLPRWWWPIPPSTTWYPSALTRLVVSRLGTEVQWLDFFDKRPQRKGHGARAGRTGRQLALLLGRLEGLTDVGWDAATVAHLETVVARPVTNGR
jgi:hypothetical protein